MIDSDWANIWAGLSGLTIAYVFVVAVLSWFVIGSSGRWWVKGLLISLAIWFGTTLYYSVNNFMGWPTTEYMQKNTIEILWFQVREPSKKVGDPGAIYLWVRVLPNNEEPEGFSLKNVAKYKENIWFVYMDKRAPRAFKLEYTRETHKQLEELNKQKQEKGARGYVEKDSDDKKKVAGGQVVNYKDRMNIKIINPEDIIPKKQD